MGYSGTFAMTMSSGGTTPAQQYKMDETSNTWYNLMQLTAGKYNGDYLIMSKDGSGLTLDLLNGFTTASATTVVNKQWLTMRSTVPNTESQLFKIKKVIITTSEESPFTFNSKNELSGEQNFLVYDHKIYVLVTDISE